MFERYVYQVTIIGIDVPLRTTKTGAAKLISGFHDELTTQSILSQIKTGSVFKNNQIEIFKNNQIEISRKST